MFVVYFFEAAQIQNHQAQRLRVTARTIQFFFERFSKKPAVVEAGQGIGDRIQFELLEFLVLQDDRHTEKSGSSEHIHKSRLQNNGTARLIGEGPTAIEHFVPDLHTLRFAQFNVTDCAEKALEKLSPRGQVETLECIRKQLEIRVLDRQTRGREGAGAGHIRYKPNLCLSPRGMGQACKLFYKHLEQPRDHWYWTLAASA